MSPEMSVALARMSTGSTIANRGLYTDGEVAAFSVKEWKGQANELLNIAKMAAQDLGMSMEFFPTSPRGMASSMRRITPPLRLLGWTVENRWDGRDKDRAPRWTLRPPQPD